MFGKKKSSDYIKFSLALQIICICVNPRNLWFKKEKNVPPEKKKAGEKFLHFALFIFHSRFSLRSTL